MSEEKVLPPFVYGKLRGHLTVKVDEILWVKTNPGNIFVELLWWGEKESHIFKPVSINLPGNVNEEDTSVTFNIRTSLLLFENYIKKSGKLIFGVFKYPSREHVGDVTVWNPFKTIFNDKSEQGYYPIFSKNRIRIGDLRISFELWMTKKDNLEAISGTDKDRKKNSGKSSNSKNQGVSSSSSVKDIEDVEQADPLFEVLNRGKELRDAMTMSVLEDAPVDNIDKVIAYDNSDNLHPSKNSGAIDANKLMDFLMGKELNPDDEVLAIKTLRSVSPTQSVVNHELKSRLTSAQSCQCCFKNTNSCSSCTSRNLSSANSVNCNRPQTSNSGISNHRTATQNEEEMRKSKHVIELVNCYKLVIQCLHLNSLGAKKVKGVSSKSNEKVKKKPGLYYMIEHLPGSQSNMDKEKPWNLKQTRFVSRKINDNEIIFGDSNYLIEAINSNFSWPKVLKQLNGTSLKIYWRYHNQRLPCYLGSVVLKDDSVTPAGLFSTFTLPVNSNSGITVGHLSLLLELGHNRKTFGSHLLSCDLLKDTNKELEDRDENVSCDCNGCRTASGERYDAIWGREMERRARDMMVSCHHQCCQSACDKNPPTKSVLSNERPIESRAKSALAESQKSSTVSPDDSENNRDLNRKEEILTNHTKFRLDDIPSNIPDSLKSDSSDSTSTKSDSVKNDLRLDTGNIRPRCLTTDASCQVTFDRSQKETRRENPDEVRLCKSCLAMSNYKLDPYSFNPNMNLYTTDAPNWSKIDRFYQPPMYIPHRERSHYQNHCQPFHSCHCCPSEIPSSHKCCYEMATAQLNAARHYGHDHYRMNEISHEVPPPPVAMPREPCSNSSEPMTIHELSISVDRIIDFPMFNRELNEDADCFVDYTFPVNQNNKVIIPHRRYSTEVSMISKEVSFSTVTKHTLTLPSSQNLNQVLTSIAFPSLDFNIWCRFYRSVPVDHVIAKAILPIGRICALKQEFEEAGGFKSVKDKVCLPLLTVASPLSVQYPTKVSGSMEVTIIYKNYSPEVSTLNRSTLNSNYRSNRDKYDYSPSNDYQRDTNSGTHSTKNSSNQCCNSIKYSTVPRTSTKNFTKTDVFNPDQVVTEPSTKPNRRPKERTTEDRALSPIQELSNSNSSKDQIENLQKNLERLVVETHVHKGESSKYKSDYDESDTSINAYLKKCRDLVQLESSSDEGINSIIPTVKPDMKRRKNKNRLATNQLIEFQKTNKDNSNSESLSSDNLLSRINDNFESDINLSDDDTLKSVSSVNSDDSSSHVGFIAFNKDFVKNDCNMRKRKESQDIPAKNFPKVNTPPKRSSVTRCTQTAELVTNINPNPTSVVKIQSGSFFKAKIEVERAINLPLLAPYGSVNKLKPSSYVSLDAFVDGNSEHLASEIVYNSTDPEWNASWNVMLPIEYLYKCDKKLVLNVMLLSHTEDGPVRACMRKNEDRSRPADEALTFDSASRYKLSHRPKGAVRKQALIDLTSLCAGLRLIFGWYSLVNESTPCSGQVKIKITPLEDISRHKSIWFKEYMEWEKGRNRPSSNTTSYSSSKLDELKMKKLVENIDAKSSLRLPVVDGNGAKTSTQKIPELKKTDSIDRDLVYISLNQKLSELDKIPESFKNKRLQSSENNQQTNLNSIYNERKRKCSDASKDLSDLNIDKDISYVNKLLSEVPLFQASSGNVVGVSKCEGTKNKDFEQPKSQSTQSSSNFKNVSEVPGCSKDLKTSRVGYNFVAQTAAVPNYSGNSINSSQKPNNSSNSRHVVSFSENLIRNKKPDSMALKTPQDFLNTSFNASDILDLEETKEKAPNNERLNIDSDRRDVNYNYGVDDDKSKTESKSDESQFNKVSNSDKIQSQYLSFSLEELDEDLIKSGSSILPSECVQACSGSESQSCVFNNKKPLRNYSETGEFRRFSPALSNESNTEMIRRSKYKSDLLVRPDQSGLSPVEISDGEGNDASKGIETLSGQSSICTDDQSMNYSEPLNAQTTTYQQNLPDNSENLNSDLMEEATSEIDRILRELSKR